MNDVQDQLTPEFAGCAEPSVDALVDRLRPRVSGSEAEQILQLILEARAHPPPSRMAMRNFVEQMNYLFDTFRIRVGTLDGEVHRFVYAEGERPKRGGEPKGYMFLINARQKHKLKLEKAGRLKLVDIASCYESNRLNNRRIKAAGLLPELATERSSPVSKVDYDEAPRMPLA
jgi:hypothetical protein